MADSSILFLVASLFYHLLCILVSGEQHHTLGDGLHEDGLENAHSGTSQILFGCWPAYESNMNNHILNRTLGKRHTEYHCFDLVQEKELLTYNCVAANLSMNWLYHLNSTALLVAL